MPSELTRRRDRRTDGWTHGQTDGRISAFCISSSYLFPLVYHVSQPLRFHVSFRLLGVYTAPLRAFTAFLPYSLLSKIASRNNLLEAGRVFVQHGPFQMLQQLLLLFLWLPAIYGLHCYHCGIFLNAPSAACRGTPKNISCDPDHYGCLSITGDRGVGLEDRSESPGVFDFSVIAVPWTNRAVSEFPWNFAK